MPEPARVLTTDAEIDAAIQQARIYEKYDLHVVRAGYSERTDRFILELDNGATHTIPRKLMQGLVDAEAADLERIELLGRGTGLYWPALDVAHSVSGLLAGVYGSEKWMALLDKERRKSSTPGADRKANIMWMFRGERGTNVAKGLDGRHRDRDGRIEEKRGDTLVRTLRKEYGDDFLRDWRGNAKLSTVREKTDMSLTELVRQHRRRK
jgi:hypothetical protein